MKKGEKSITLQAYFDETETLKELQDLMNSIPGFHVSVIGKDVVLSWNEKTYRKYARHNGGRKRITAAREIDLAGHSMKELLQLQEHAVYTCGDVVRMQKEGIPAETIAKELGLSRATYFRRCKLHKELEEMTENCSRAF